MNAISKTVASGDKAALTEALRADLSANHSNIPDALKQLKAWVVWKVAHNDRARGKFGKVPVYPTNGGNRCGTQGSPEDRAGLGTWEQAFAAFQRDPSLAGVGIAMLPDFGVVALDADKCVSQLDGRPSVADHAHALCGSTYTETSPSGSGVRAFWLGAAQDGKNHAEGFELFHAKGFVTVTGNRISGRGVETLSPDHAARLQAVVQARPPATSPERPEQTELARLTEQAVAEATLPRVREALFAISADDRETWTRMGHALKTIGDAAEPLWHEWSATSAKYEPGDAQRVWQSFQPTQTGIGAIFAEAKRHGWAGGDAALPARPAAAPRTIRADTLAATSFPPLRWAIPNLLPEGLAILAGRPKAGKSFLAMQLALAVASGNGNSLALDDIPAGDVLYAALEDSERRLRTRLDGMHPYSAPARLHFATEWPRIGAGGIEELAAWCDANPRPSLIIIDTLRAFKGPANARSSAYDADAQSVAPLLDFTRSRAGLACLVVHHTRKMEADDPFDTISGTLGLTGIFDSLMVLTRSATGNAQLAGQGRDLEPYTKALERDQRTGGWIISGDSGPPAKTGERQELLDLLTRAKEPMSLAALAEAVGKKPDTTRRLLQGLTDEGHIYRPGHGLYAPTQFTQSEQEYDPHIF